MQYVSAVPSPVLNQRLMSELVGNAMLARQEFFRRFMDPRRDIDDECGFPKGMVPLETYQRLWERHAIAARVVEVMPKETWQVTPMVYDDDDPETVTPFEKAWDELSNQLQGEDSYYRDEEGSIVWEYLLRLDVMSGIGQYGVLLLGFDDGADLSQPVTKAKRLTYLRVFHEGQAQVTRLVDDRTSVRYGHPEAYSLMFHDARDGQALIGGQTTLSNVHWSRVIHVADNLATNEVWGVPRMRPVLNNLLGLEKLYAGSPEMYWKGAFPGLSFETHPTVGGDAALDTDGLRATIENYMNGLQRYLALTGMSAKTLSPQVVDPTPQINTQIDAICIKLGMPKRVFMGSERGELASSQDDDAWNDRLRARQRIHVTPRVVVPFVNRLINVGVLPTPKGFTVEWPNLDSLSEGDKADLAVKKTQALAQYVGGNVRSVIPEADYLTEVLGFDEEKAAQMTDAVTQAADERMAEQQAAELTAPEIQGETVPPEAQGEVAQQ